MYKNHFGTEKQQVRKYFTWLLFHKFSVSKSFKDTCIRGDNLKSVYVIMCFPSFGYQHERADDWKSCILNRYRLSSPHLTLTCHGICDIRLNDVTSF